VWWYGNIFSLWMMLCSITLKYYHKPVIVVNTKYDGINRTSSRLKLMLSQRAGYTNDTHTS